ncbi:amino acid permease [Streptomyces sp. TP-A0356]|uniref:amino acid permease n=1 Tax=Streptomyces sp. TP-A0356 TaxID=1359208 RepID=UPI0006E1E311|nr:amino acid permease [Streptomyces sp. TP-A0356]
MRTRRGLGLHLPEPPGDDGVDLKRFGYRQELARCLGPASSFAAGFSFISVMTGVFQLFGFGFASGGPASIWTWPLVFLGQLAVALCFAEMAGQFPLAGSVYQWSKHIARPAVSWLSGWIMAIGAVATAAAVAVAYQVILPQITSAFQIIGGPADAGTTSTPNGAGNAIVLALGLVVLTTLVNIAGVRLTAKMNNVGVAAEMIGVTLLIVMLAVHIKRGPQVVLETGGTGAGHSSGYLGAFLLASLMSAYVLYGFDTAGSLAEETMGPRRHAPRAILRALTAAFLVGGLLMLVALMAVRDITARQLGTLGMPYLVKSTLGTGIGDAFLVCAAIAVTACCLAVQTAAIRLLFSMARDGRLPFGKALARVSPRSRTPVVPAVLTGALTIALLVVNIGNRHVFYTLTSVAVILFYIPYLMVTGPMLVRRLRGDWPRADHGPHFTMGRWGLAVNVVAVLYGAAMTVNLAWPRAAVYPGGPWYYRWGAILLTAVVTAVGGLLYLRYRHVCHSGVVSARS